MMRLATVLAVAGVLPRALATRCHGDNCLRALKATQRVSSALEFCATFTSTPTAIPNFAADPCGGDASRLSSACSCIASPDPSTPAPTTLTTVETLASPTTTALATPTKIEEPCAVLGSSWSAQASVGEFTVAGRTRKTLFAIN